MPPRTPAQQRRRASETPDGQPVRVTRRRAQTRERLLAAASEVFSAQGYGATSIGDVCDRAGFTRGAFYSNFDSLAEVLLALYEQQAALLIDEIDRSLGDVEDLDDASDVVDRIVGALRLDRDWLLLRIEFVAHAARDPEVGRLLIEQRASVRQAIAVPFQRLTDRLGVGPSADRIDAFAHALSLLYDGICLQVLIEGDVAAARRRLAELGLSVFLAPQP